MTSEPRLPFDEVGPLPDEEARRAAVDPHRNVVLEASAGTGKTRVLVERYVNLLRAGVDPDHILAITFTRKAAAEMRQRIVERLKEASRLSAADAARWRDLRGRLGDIALSTIDAFCLRLLREFPLEADVDPAFELADETQVLRLAEEALDASLRICRGLAREDDDVALVFAQLGERRLRAGLSALLDRRLVAPELLRRFLAVGPRDLTAAVACRRAAERLRDQFQHAEGGLDAFLRCGPVQHPQFAMLALDIAALSASSDEPGTMHPVFGEGLDTRPGQAAFRALVDRLRAYFLTLEGKPRGERFTGTPFRSSDCVTADAWKRHRSTAAALAPGIAESIRAFRRDLNVVLSRGVWRLFGVTLSQYQRTLDARALLDFAGVLERAVDLLRQMDEFARSRYRLESRYHHVLVDEFQDTSRAQWDLVAQLVRSWGEGAGASSEALAPSIFIVGDRKQSIYGFRDAEAGLVDEAAAFITSLRPEGDIRRAISVSFRAAPSLLAFVNDVFGTIVPDEEPPATRRGHEFRFGDTDKFPLGDGPGLSAGASLEPSLGLVVGDTVAAAAEAVADEVTQLLTGIVVRDKVNGVARSAQPADIAILFRSRESHREFEAALQRRGISTYVYKGLGFFEADEIQDAVALLRYLASPLSNLRAAALLRSRFVRLSDEGVRRLTPDLAGAILGPSPVGDLDLPAEDATVLAQLRSSIEDWLAMVDTVSPAQLLDRVLSESAYYMEIRGPRRLQARENLKKLRGLVRRIQNRGYATLGRITDHLDRLAVGDESNAAIDAVDAVSLMTVHAAKGLEYPIVFVVNLGRGTGGPRAPIRVAASLSGVPAVAIADYQSEADEESAARDREETKRLLYVALTRARDRLYLSATVQNGICRAGRGSLAEVLPKSMLDLFGQAATSGPADLVWAAGDSREHRLLVRRYEPAARPD